MTKVFVYWNLHRKVWSVKALDGPFKGRVFKHAEKITLRYATGKVSLAGNARVRREGKKNVHAGIVGFIGARDPFVQIDDPISITYNPYKDTSFVQVTEDGSRPEWHGSHLVSLSRTVAMIGAAYRPVVTATKY